MHIVGAYIHSGHETAWKSVKAEAKEYHELFLQPDLVVLGDFNDSFKRMERIA